LEYKPKTVSKKTKTVVLVGKGVTFDSGGISLKPSPRMEEMKHDMTGAATLMGTIVLAAKLKSPNRIVAILAFTENMPAGNAVKPGDVVTSRSGKTVEIQNTDAEGRLVLADVLDYAEKFKPDVMLDAATLTGAVAIALGKQCCAVMGTDQKVVDQLVSLGAEMNERIWQLPLYDDYIDDMRSEYADLKNIGGARMAGTIKGGIFLKQFVKSSIPWAHLDIACTAWDMGHVPYHPKKGASGAHVRTLARFVSEYQ